MSFLRAYIFYEHHWTTITKISVKGETSEIWRVMNQSGLDKGLILGTIQSHFLKLFFQWILYYSSTPRQSKSCQQTNTKIISWFSCYFDKDLERSREDNIFWAGSAETGKIENKSFRKRLNRVRLPIKSHWFSLSWFRVLS